MKPSSENLLHPTSGYPPIFELWHGLSHVFGVFLGVVALVLGVVLASLHSEGALVAATAVYGASLIALYLASSLYHLTRTLVWKKVFLVCDHACIYLLIAGTYTPFLLGPLRGVLGWSLFGVIWGFAVLGFVREMASPSRGGFWSTAIYLGMGWICLFAIVPLWNNLSPAGFLWLLAGGLAYSFGVVFYLWRTVVWNHLVWHFCVLLGSLFHFFSILTFLVNS